MKEGKGKPNTVCRNRARGGIKNWSGVGKEKVLSNGETPSSASRNSSVEEEIWEDSENKSRAQGRIPLYIKKSFPTTELYKSKAGCHVKW